jgi:hypothetical protein
MLAREANAIRTLVAALAVPLPPVPAFATHFAMPGAAILDDPLPTEGVPIRLATLLAIVFHEKLLEGNGLTVAGQFTLLLQLLF